MRHTFTIAILFFISCKAKSNCDTNRGCQFDLKGKIVEEVALTPGCGVVAWGTVIVFSIDELNGMSYENENIGIIITCPGDYEKNFFVMGKRYKVNFSDKNQASFEWAIANKDRLSKNGLSFDPYAIEVTKIP